MGRFLQVSTQSPWRPWCGSSPRRSSRAGRLPAVPRGHSWCPGEGRGAFPRLHLSPTGCLAPGMWRCFSPGTGSPRRCLRLLSSGTASLRWNSSFCRPRPPSLTQRVGWRRGCQCAGWLWQWTRALAATGGASRRSLFPRARPWTGSSLLEGIGGMSRPRSGSWTIARVPAALSRESSLEEGFQKDCVSDTTRLGNSCFSGNFPADIGRKSAASPRSALLEPGGFHCICSTKTRVFSPDGNILSL